MALSVSQTIKLDRRYMGYFAERLASFVGPAVMGFHLLRVKRRI